MTKRTSCLALSVLLLAGAAYPAKSSSEQDRLMKRGLDALYERHDAKSAAADFRKVLEMNANHYGATFQLARALDQTGPRQEALQEWAKMLAMAESSRDTGTLALVRERLAKEASSTQDAIMREALDALYVTHDTTRAIELFRRVLKSNPNHYGATFQLAKALDFAGRSAESRPYWEKTLSMAEGFRDEATARSAREHIEKLGK